MAGYDRSIYESYLARVPMFARCTPAQLDRLADLGNAVAVVEGSPIVREGDGGEEFFVILTGKARVTRGDREVASIGEGDYFGELALFDPAPRNATVTAVSQVALVSLPRDAFTKALDELPGFREALLQGMARRLHDVDSHA